MIAAGLPLTRFGAEKEDFIRYLLKEKEVSFVFEDESFSIVIERVSVYSQCYVMAQWLTGFINTRIW